MVIGRKRTHLVQEDSRRRTIVIQLDGGMYMENIERENFRIEIFRGRIRYRTAIIMIISGALVFVYLLQWDIHQVNETYFVLGTFTAVLLYLLMLFIVWFYSKMAIILTRDALIHTGLAKVILWEDIDHLIFDPRAYRKGLVIYYRDGTEIKKFGLDYDSYENRALFLASLRKFSKVHGFAVRDY